MCYFFVLLLYILIKNLKSSKKRLTGLRALNPTDIAETIFISHTSQNCIILPKKRPHLRLRRVGVGVVVKVLKIDVHGLD